MVNTFCSQIMTQTMFLPRHLVIYQKMLRTFVKFLYNRTCIYSICAYTLWEVFIWLGIYFLSYNADYINWEPPKCANGLECLLHQASLLVTQENRDIAPNRINILCSPRTLYIWRSVWTIQAVRTSPCGFITYHYVS